MSKSVVAVTYSGEGNIEQSPHETVCIPLMDTTHWLYRVSLVFEASEANTGTLES